jgi:hypothetical protein
VVFLLVWGMLNFFWLSLLRRGRSLVMIVVLVLLSRLKYDIILMTANFPEIKSPASGRLPRRPFSLLTSRAARRAIARAGRRVSAVLIARSPLSLPTPSADDAEA